MFRFHRYLDVVHNLHSLAVLSHIPNYPIAKVATLEQVRDIPAADVFDYSH